MHGVIKRLLLLHFLNDGIRTTFVVLLPFIASDLSLSLTLVGFLGSSQPLIASILALPTGFLASRFGGFHLLLYLLIIYSLGALGIALSGNLSILLAAFTLGSLGFGMFHTIGFSLVAKTSDKTNIGKAMGDFTSMGEIGRIAIPPIAVFFVSLIGWRPTLIILSCIGFSAFCIFRFFLPRQDTHSVHTPLEKESHRDFLKHIGLLLTTKRFFLITLSSIFDSFASSPIYIFLPFLLLAKGLSIELLAITTASFFIGSLAGKTLLGRSVDKIGNKRVFIFSEISMAIILMLIAISSHFILLFLFAFFLGVFTKGTSPVVQTMFSQMAHKDHYDKVYAVSELAIGSAAVVTIIIMGIIADIFGVYFVFYACAALAVIAVAPILLLPKISLQVGKF